MMNVALCLTQHDPRLVALALLVCLVGVAASVQLFGCIRSAAGLSRFGWVMLAAVATGTMIWATHFVAMMAYRASAPVVLDPMQTLYSLLVAIGMAAPGLTIAAMPRRWAGAIGGGIIGVAIALMHYLGMAAYHVDGIVSWDVPVVAASVVLSIGFSAAAFGSAPPVARNPSLRMMILLASAVAALHFTGMAAMHITVVRLGQGLSSPSMNALAIATAVASLIIVGCAAISALIDGHTQGESYRRLRRMALYDGLTDLPNRMSFNEELRLRFRTKGGHSSMAVIMMDLSRFKVVNDTYGHLAGDQLLMALAARLTGLLRPGECIGRLGGDEFAAVISYDAAEELTDFLARIRAACDAPFVFDRFTAAIGTNIGVALAVRDGSDPDALLAKADLAMYRAKSVHSSEPCFYDAQMDDAVRARRELACDLRDALETEAFELHYQVQAATGSGEIKGYEALLRWNHPVRGMIPPAEFIPLAEDSGEVVPLSIWILRQACFEAALWPNRHPVSVNLSPKHLSDPRLVATVRAALDDSGLPATRLVLELTESAIIHDRRFALQQLHALKAMGVSIALDDFGVGYSSLDVLRSFPFDCIKLDASFVAEVEHDEQAISILRSVTSLGGLLRMPVLAEGIERPAQLAIVAREGCSSVQGYLIGRPSRRLADPDDVRRTMQGDPALACAEGQPMAKVSHAA
jgi:diguanylate cyclase (GGDEF)-like protein